MEGVKLALKEFSRHISRSDCALKESHTSLFSRFTYETRGLLSMQYEACSRLVSGSPTDQPQEGSGEAIHLAASKGRDEVGELEHASRSLQGGALSCGPTGQHLKQGRWRRLVWSAGLR